MDRRITALIGSISLAVAASSVGQEAKSLHQARPAAHLVSFDELQKRLGDPKLRLLDARPRASYDEVHIPGAVWVDTKAAEALAASPTGLADRRAWEAWLAPLGIGADTEVLIYDDNRQLDAARLWWLLTYLGVQKVGLIDGIFPLWGEEERPVTRDVSPVASMPFRVTFRIERHASQADVLEALKGGKARVVDARSRAEHLGAEARSKRGGRVPTACHLEWKELVDQDGKFLDEATSRTRLEALGVKRDEPVITHCQGGGRASVDAFVLERLGYSTRNYYLGWSDWGNADDTPVAIGSEDGKSP